MSRYPPIAIVGTACRFPGQADTPEGYWRNIAGKKDAVGPIPDDRWDPDCLGPDQSEFAQVGGFIDGIYDFDPVLFAISPREADSIDPQQRMLIELALRSIEDASISDCELSKSRTGVFVGVINHDYARVLLSDSRQIGPHTGLGRSGSIAANRISYVFDLKGPSITFDTACSSSLVAVDAACRSLHSGGCDIALAGGANAIILPESYLEFGRARMLSVAGRCRAFDSGADGFVRAEGAGLIALKRLADALADGDRIRAVIASTAVNQDGRSSGIMAPNADAQAAMMRHALELAELAPEHIGYVEAHGTGTQSGDTAEAKSIGSVYGTGQRQVRLPVGSVKTNIGHTESAAGIAGLIKAQLCIENNTIAPNLHFDAPNPDIHFDRLNVRIPVECESWSKNLDDYRVAAVNSFGFGGTNAHAILCQAPCPPAPPKRQSDKGSPYLIPLSRAAPSHFGDPGNRSGDLADDDLHPHRLAVAAARNSRQRFRRALIVDTDAAHEPRLSDFLSQPQTSDSFVDSSAVRGKLAFVFSGIGRNWGDAGRQLYQGEPVFKSAIDNCDRIFCRRHGNSIVRQVLEHGMSPDSRIRHLHPLLFSVQVALYELWRSRGIMPEAIIGHSIGEAAAAWAAGALDLAEAARIIAGRCNSFENLEGRGAMLAAAVGQERAAELIGENSAKLHIASVNSPGSTTLSGTADAIAAAGEALSSEGVFHRLLDIHIPFHSPLVDEAKSATLQALGMVEQRTLRLQWISSIGGISSSRYRTSEDMWWRNFGETANFSDAIASAYDDGCTIFLEVSPVSILAGNICECLQLRSDDAIAVPSLRSDIGERASIAAATGKLFESGINPDWSQIIPKAVPQRLPGTPFQRRRHAISVPVRHTSNVSDTPAGNDVDSRRSGTHDYRFATDRTHWLRTHTLHGKMVFPAAGLIAVIADAAGRSSSVQSWRIFDLRLHRLIEPAAADSQVCLRLSVESSQFDDLCEVSVAQSNSDSPTHSSASCKIRLDRSPIRGMDLAAAAERCTTRLSRSEIAARIDRAGFGHTADDVYGIEVFQGSGAQARAVIASLERPVGDTGDLPLDPGIIDACFRAVAAAFMDGESFIPVAIEEIWIQSCDLQSLMCTAVKTSSTQTQVKLDLEMTSLSGDIVAQFKGFTIAVAKAHGLASANTLPIRILKPEWKSIYADDIVPNCLVDLQPDRLRHKARTLAQKYRRKQYYAKVLPALDRRALNYAIKALRTNGLTLERGVIFDLNVSASRLDVADMQFDLFHGLILLLEKHKLIKINSAQCTVIEDCSAVSDSLALECESDIRCDPDSLAEHLLIGRCGTYLPKVLTGESSGIEVLFSDESYDDLEHLYSSSPTCRIYNEILTEAVGNIASSWPMGRPLQILEVGGGTGALLKCLEPILSSCNVRYTFTDVSSHFVNRAQFRFRHLDNATFRTLDFDAEPEIQGFRAKSFDLILASDALHAAASLGATLDHLRRLLRRNGMLQFIELTQDPDWTRISFAMLPGWWHNTDSDRRIDSPCRSQEQWTDILTRNGFTLNAAIGDADGGGDSLHTVFLAQLAHSEIEPDADAPDALEPCERWLVFVDHEDNSLDLFDELEQKCAHKVAFGSDFAQSASDFQINPEDSEHFFRLLRTLNSQNRALDAIVFVTAPHLADADSETCFASQFNAFVHAAMALTRLLQAADRIRFVLPRIIVVNIQPGKSRVATHDLSNLLACVVRGIARTARNEYPSIEFNFLNVEPDSSISLTRLLEMADAEADRFEVLSSGNDAKSIRLSRWQPTLADIGDNESIRIAIAQSRQLDDLRFAVAARRQCGATQLRIRVSAASLNFRDIMVAMDALPEDAITHGRSGNELGIECAGVVIECGRSVRRFSPGCRVVALTPGSLANEVIADEDFCFELPDHLSFEQVAAIPTATVTAELCVHESPMKSTSVTVLIHTASGGVGLALVYRYAQAGARIFCTAGSGKKRQFLRDFANCEVFDSRSTKFADEILSATGGRGVDLIVNTLGIAASEANSRVLAHGGTFIELGKYAESNRARQQLQAVNENARYAIVDMDRLWRTDPERLSRLFLDSMKQVCSDPRLQFPFRTFPASEIAGAFKHMAGARHIGKVVVEFDTCAANIERSSAWQLPKGEYSVLIAGGTRGFGLATALWLARRGARSLLVIGRSATESAELKNARNEFEQLGACVTFGAVDIADFESLRQWVEKMQDSHPPIRYVFQCAMTIEDSLIANLTPDSLDQVLTPKVKGTWNLYRATSHCKLIRFVMYSSVTSVIGPAGQAAYAAGNEFQDSFAPYLRERGIPAVSIKWGAVSDFGYVADNPDHATSVERYGILAQSANDLLQALPEILSTDDSAEFIVASGPWAEHAWKTGDSHFAPRDSGVVPTPAESQAISKNSANSGAGLANRVANCVARILELDNSSLDHQAPLADYGLDSLMAVELAHLIESECAIDVSAFQLLDNATISSLAKNARSAR